MIIFVQFSVQSCDAENENKISGTGGESYIAITAEIVCVKSSKNAAEKQTFCCSDIANVTATISGGGFSPSISHDLVGSEESWSGIIGNIPAGAQNTVRADAYSENGDIIYTGSSTVSTQKGQISKTAIKLEEGNTAITVGQTNETPVITRLFSDSGSIEKGGSVRLTAEASDPEDGTLYYMWTSDRPGTFDNSASSSTVFTLSADAEYGPVIFTFDISDGYTHASGKITLNISDLPNLNTAPEIHSSFQSAITIPVCGEIVFIIRASDPEGKGITFQWGSYDGAIGAQNITVTAAYTESKVLWSAPACSSDTRTICVSISDPEGLSIKKEFLPVQACGEPMCKLNNPDIDPPSGKYTGSVIVSISNPYPGAQVKYTTDGSNPSGSGTAMPGTIVTIEKSTTLKAYAFKDGWIGSDISSAEYTIVPEARVFLSGGIGQVEDDPSDRTALCWIDGTMSALSGVTGESVFVSGGDVYVGGYCLQNKKIVGAYWVNGNRMKLHSTSQNSYGKSITVANGDVYVAGYWGDTSFTACYWIKNGGQRNDLDSGGKPAYAKSIAVNGTDIYIAGFWNNGSGRDIACYWKNGVRTDLPCPNSAEAFDIFVAEDGTIYTAGFYNTSNWNSTQDPQYPDYNPNRSGRNNNTACIWVNSTRIDLLVPGKTLKARAIYVSDGNVYISGEYGTTDSSLYWVSHTACFWINGSSNRVDLNPDDSTNFLGNTSDIQVFNSAVYVSGYWYNTTTNISCYWRNDRNSRIDISDGSSWTYCSSLFVTKGE